MTDKYSNLRSRIKEIYNLRSASALLGWDQETFMPPHGGEARAEVQSVLSKILQEKYCVPELGELLEACSADSSLSAEAQVNVREVNRDREKYLKIPASLVEELSKTTSLSQQVWSESRTTGDTKKFIPWLKKVIELKRQEAECLGYPEVPYDALLDTYEPGATASEISPILEALEKEIVPLLQKITHSSHQPDVSLVTESYSVSEQKIFNQNVLEDMGFDLKAGRLDESAHPFTEGVWPTDVRLTTRYRDTDLLGALFGTVHEGGHGLYEQGFLPEHFGTPMGESVSLGIHESQSRLWENQIARSLPFWKEYFPRLKKVFPDQLNGVGLAKFYAAINAVQPSFIRVEADEVTYNLHIALRFELEKELFAKNLEVGDLEGAWNEKMKKMFGLTPSTPMEGYLQDVHWSLGLFGYFPTYSLGNIYAAQLFDKLSYEQPGILEKAGKDAFVNIREWLRKNVHQWGRRYSPKELIERVTGAPPDPSHFIKYLSEKYSELYNV